MQIDTLKVYCDLVDTQSFSAAAERNGITQSAVSQKLRNLEDLYGVPFVLRGGGRTEKITPEGRVFYDSCREIVASYESIPSRLLRSQGALRGEVRVASVPNLGLYELVEARRRLRRRYPGVQVEVLYLPWEEAYEAVREKKVDFALLAYPQAAKGVEVETCWQDKLLLICPPQHRLAHHGAVALRDLRGERFVHCHPDEIVATVLSDIFTKAKVEVETLFTVRNAESALRAVDVEGALTMLPESQAPEKPERYRRVEVNARGLWRPVGMVRRKGKGDELAPAAMELARILRR